MLALEIAARMEARLEAETESEVSGQDGDLCEFTEPHLKQIVQPDDVEGVDG